MLVRVSLAHRICFRCFVRQRRLSQAAVSSKNLPNPSGSTADPNSLHRWRHPKTPAPLGPRNMPRARRFRAELGPASERYLTQPWTCPTCSPPRTLPGRTAGTCSSRPRHGGGNPPCHRFGTCDRLFLGLQGVWDWFLWPKNLVQTDSYLRQLIKASRMSHR